MKMRGTTIIMFAFPRHNNQPRPLVEKIGLDSREGWIRQKFFSDRRPDGRRSRRNFWRSHIFLMSVPYFSKMFGNLPVWNMGVRCW